jgi:phenylpyruvate tautomerase PptA (4-oxalocrotonate tautomerase family)
LAISGKSATGRFSMPMVTVTAPKGALNAQQRAELSEKLTRVLLRLESGMQEESENPAARSISQVLIHEIEPTAWAVGGKFDNSFVSEGGRFLTVVTVPEHALKGEDKKERMVAAVHDTFREVLKLPPENGIKWSPGVIVQEVPDGNWGVGGTIRRMPDILAYVRGRVPRT